MRKKCIALGSFDGLHTGHMQVISQCTAASREMGLEPCIMLFDRHPLFEICGKAPGSLLLPNDRNRILDGLCVSRLPVSFSEIKDMSPLEFVKEILVKNEAEAVCCGFNYRFGKNGQGNAEDLKTICSQWGIRAFVVPSYEKNGQPVSSTRIRNALLEGKTEGANELLGRPFQYTARVVHGDFRGTGMGFPTANQLFEKGFTVPKYGVYASRTIIDRAAYPSVTNVGIRPTVGNNVLLSETNIIGFSGDLYGREITVELLSYIREECVFSDFDALSAQIKNDVRQSIEIYDVYLSKGGC